MSTGIIKPNANLFPMFIASEPGENLDGLTVRTYIASQQLAALIASPKPIGDGKKIEKEVLVDHAIILTDALIRALNQEEE